MMSPENPTNDSLDFRAVNGIWEARPYQKTGVKFIIDSDFSCIIGDEMRLGKTPQSLLALKNKYAERTPVLIIVRSANIWQWHAEYKAWVDNSPMGVFVIEGTKTWIPPGFHAYIISMDTLGRPGTCKFCKHSLSIHSWENRGCGNKRCKCSHTDPTVCTAGDSIAERLAEIPFKLIIADEAHSFKNDDSQRSRAIVNFLESKNTCEATRTLHYQCPYCENQWDVAEKFQVVNGTEKAVYRPVQICAKCKARIGTAREERGTVRRTCGFVGLTGTAVKNRADEYYIPLHLVAPQLAPTRKKFRDKYLEQSSNGQWNHISRYAREAFKRDTTPYILRREKEDVYTDLPAINRMYTLIEPDMEGLKDEYNSTLDKLNAMTMGGRRSVSFFEANTCLMALRAIAGKMKVMWLADYILNLFDERDSADKQENGRIVIGIHHKDVRDVLKYKLSPIPGCLTLSGEDSAERKFEIQQQFQTSPEKVLAVNMVAGGMGMDFHYVHNVIVLERAWSYADEQQFEYRFYNPDRSIYGDNNLSVEYILAKGTIDQWFHDMIEEKKQIVGETIGTNWDLSQQPKLFSELIAQTLSNRL